MAMSVKIYGLFDDTGIRYIGKTSQSLGRRLTNHLAEVKSGTGLYKVNWLRKLTANGKKPKIILLEVVPQSIWQDRERAWISFGRTIGWNLTNGTDGGDTGGGMTGRKHSEETKAKMRLAQANSTFSPEARQKARLTLLGRKLSPEHAAALRLSRIGKGHSPAAREKIKLAWKHRKTKKEI